MADNEIQTAETTAEHAPIPETRKKSGRVLGRKGPKLDSRGVPKTNWDNPKHDPNLRTHAGDDPTGESNTLT